MKSTISWMPWCFDEPIEQKQQKLIYPNGNALALVDWDWAHGAHFSRITKSPSSPNPNAFKLYTYTCTDTNRHTHTHNKQKTIRMEKKKGKKTFSGCRKNEVSTERFFLLLFMNHTRTYTLAQHVCVCACTPQLWLKLLRFWDVISCLFVVWLFLLLLTSFSLFLHIN